MSAVTSILLLHLRSSRNHQFERSCFQQSVITLRLLAIVIRSFGLLRNTRTCSRGPIQLPQARHWRTANSSSQHRALSGVYRREERHGKSQRSKRHPSDDLRSARSELVRSVSPQLNCKLQDRDEQPLGSTLAWCDLSSKTVDEASRDSWRIVNACDYCDRTRSTA